MKGEYKPPLLVLQLFTLSNLETDLEQLTALHARSGMAPQTVKETSHMWENPRY
jgi:hypothetical protein